MKIDNRLKKTMIISIIVIFALFIVAIIYGMIRNRALSYSELETKMKEAAIEYYEYNPSLLPQVEENEIKITVETLVEEEYLKPLEKYLKDSPKCDGEVYVTLRNGKYVYTPYLICENYTTSTLYKKIVENETIIEDVNAGEDGLYSYNNTLIYRGEIVNNYISFAGQLWRILRIDSDNNIRMIQDEAFSEMIWDNRYNIDTNANSGYNYFEKSRLKEYFDEIYAGKYGQIFDEKSKQLLVNNYLCLDTKNNSSFRQDGIINCNVKSEDRYSFGLLDVSEYFIASVDQNCNSFNNNSCKNYNYLNKYSSFWSMNAYSENSYQSYYIGGGAHLEDVNRKEDVRLVVTLSKHALYVSGNGSMDNPYTIK